MFFLHTSGVVADDADIASACGAVAAAEDAEAGDVAGQALIDRVSALVDGVGHEPDAISGLLSGLYGEALRLDLGAGGRDQRLKQIRSYQFQRGLPWVARIYERQPSGAVRPTWLVIERVTDLVRAMDPNPWDDIPEERALPTSDFQVLWELDACTSFAVA